MSEEHGGASYTPGPWRVENLTERAEESWFDIFDSQGFAVAEAVKDKATASLIAAAPDLLEACREAAMAIPAETQLCEMLNAAIAKAEGTKP